MSGAPAAPSTGPGADPPLCAQSGNLEAAYRFYTTGLKTARDPELRATMLGNRSVLWARMGHWGKALEDAEEGVQLRPEWSRSHECKGAALEVCAAGARAVRRWCTRPAPVLGAAALLCRPGTVLSLTQRPRWAGPWASGGCPGLVLQGTGVGRG